MDPGHVEKPEVGVMGAWCATVVGQAVASITCSPSNHASALARDSSKPHKTHLEFPQA